MLGPSFYQKLNDVSESVGMNPRDLLLTIYFESGANPAAKNPNGGATGLIQFMPSTLKAMGLGPEDRANFGSKSAEDQLDYVKKYIDGKRSLMGGKPFTSATQYYHANFFPATLTRWHGDNPFANKNVVVVSSRSKDPRERAAYNANKILDTDKDGVITVGDLTNTMMSAEKAPGFKQLLAQLNNVAGAGSVSEKKILNHTVPDTTINTEDQNKMLALFIKKVDNFLDGLTSSASVENNEVNYIITVNSSTNDFDLELEYSKILCCALKEELGLKSDILSNGKNIEIQCNSSEDINKTAEALKEMSHAISNVFENAIKTDAKIYNIVSYNSKSSYQELNVKLAEVSNRKFKLKFIRGQK